MNRQLNQVVNQTMKKESRANYWGGAYYNSPNISMETIESFKSIISVHIAYRLFRYFSSETGARKNYKRVFNSEFEKIYNKSTHTIISALKEIKDSCLFLFIDQGNEGKIIINNNDIGRKMYEEFLQGKRSFLLTNSEKTSLKNEENIVDFNSKKTTEGCNKLQGGGEVDYKGGVKSTSRGGCNLLHPLQMTKTIDNIDLETNFENSQESYIKNTYIKKPSLKEVGDLGFSSKKNNFTENLFADLEKMGDGFFKNELKEEKKIEVKTTYEKKETIELKKVFSENKQDQVANDFPELQQEKKRASEAIKDLTDAEREVQSFLTKDLEILNQDLFFSFVRKLPNDMIMSKARYVLEKVSAGKVTSPEGFLRAILAKELAKNETSGNVEVTGLVKQNDYEKAILFCSEIPSSLPQYKFVTNAVSKNFATNIENNKKRIAGELYRCYCFGLLENRQEYKEKLDLIMSGLPKYLHIQDFKDILECDTALDKAKKDRLIEMFRENM